MDDGQDGRSPAVDRRGARPEAGRLKRCTTFWGLVSAYWLSDRWREAWGLTVVVLAITLLISKAAVWAAEASADFIASLLGPGLAGRIDLVPGTYGTALLAGGLVAIYVPVVTLVAWRVGPRSLIRSRAMRWSESISASKRATSQCRARRCSVVETRWRKARPTEREKAMPK